MGRRSLTLIESCAPGARRPCAIEVLDDRERERSSGVAS